MTEPRVADYDRVAAGYDRRYDLHTYAGVHEALTRFLGGGTVSAILEVGCGTGHWLSAVARMESSALAPARLKPSPYKKNIVAGVEPSPEMIARARVAAPSAWLARGRAEALPWRDATFDRVFCINALHHFPDRARFFAEARRILKPGGGLMTIAKDPHAEADTWWVYDYFPETVGIDRDRYARVRTLRGELSLAGFATAESYEADHVEALTPASEALTSGLVDRAYTSQLTVLTDEEFDRGVARIRAADQDGGGALQLVTDFRLYATIGWLE
jgi:ubiquinone/menaquinone biosynthesis C-methylase UbiE